MTRVTRSTAGAKHISLSPSGRPCRATNATSLPHAFIALICWRRSGKGDSADKLAQRAHARVPLPYNMRQPLPGCTASSVWPYASCSLTSRLFGGATSVLRHPRERSSPGTAGATPMCPPSSANHRRAALHRARGPTPAAFPLSCTLGAPISHCAIIGSAACQAPQAPHPPLRHDA